MIFEDVSLLWAEFAIQIRHEKLHTFLASHVVTTWGTPTRPLEKARAFRAIGLVHVASPITSLDVHIQMAEPKRCSRISRSAWRAL